MFHVFHDLMPLRKRVDSQQASFIRGLHRIRMMYYSIRWQLRKTACPVCVFQELSVSTCLMSLHSVLWWIPGQKALERADGVYKRESLSAGYARGCLPARSATPNTSPTSCPPPEHFLQTPRNQLQRRETLLSARSYTHSHPLVAKKQRLINSVMSRCHINRKTWFPGTWKCNVMIIQSNEGFISWW